MLQMTEYFFEILKNQVEIAVITRPADDFNEDRQKELKHILMQPKRRESV